MKILVAVDGSPFTLRMVEYLAAHAVWLSPEHAYTVITVATRLLPRAASAISKATLDEYYRDESEGVLKPLRPVFEGHGLKPVYLPKVGLPAQEIANTATQGGFDLVVMGSHGYSAVGNVVLGSVATQVLAQCKVPVLLVR